MRVEEPTTSSIPNRDAFLRSRIAASPAGISLHSHEDGSPSREVLENLQRVHRTAFYFLLIVLLGELVYSVDFRDIEVRSGEALFIKPWQARRPSPYKDDCDFHKLTFGPEVVARLSSRHRFWVDPRGNQKVALGPAAIRRVENSLASLKSATADQGGSELPRSYLNSILEEIEFAYFAGMGDQPDQDLDRYMLFQNLVEEGYLSQPRISELAKTMGLSENGLYKLVMNWAGISPKAYLNHRILLEAQRLIHAEGLSVKEISARLNFIDENYFSRFFRRQAGIPVSAFKARSIERSRP